MASVQKHKGKWRVRGKVPATDPKTGADLRDDDGHALMRDVYYGTYTTKPEAENRRKEVDGELVRTGRVLDTKAGRDTFGSFAADWIEWKRGHVATGRVKARTVDDYADLLRRYVLPVFASRPINSINTRDATAFHARLVSDKKLRPATVQHGYNVFRWVMEFAVRNRALGDNPAKDADLSGAERVMRYEGTPLSRAMVAAVVAAVAERCEVYALAVRFLASTGLRAAEFAGLNVGDLRLTRKAGGVVKGSVHVVRTRKWKAGECAVGTPKSRKSRRTVPLPASLAADLALFLETVHPDGDNPDAPLWPGRVESRGGVRAKGQRVGLLPVELDWSRPVNPSALYKSVVLPAYRAAGVPEGTRLHDLRHTYATLQLMAGEPYQKVSRWLGHASFVVTLTIYAHWIEDEDEESTLDFTASAEQARRIGGNRTSDPDSNNVVPLRPAR